MDSTTRQCKHQRRRLGRTQATPGERAYARKLRKVYGAFGPEGSARVPDHLQATLRIGTTYGMTTGTKTTTTQRGK